MATANKTFKYKKPNPFVLPALFTTDTNPVVNVPRETLHYSATIIEEIMKNINDEYEARNRTKPTWKAYKAGLDDFDTFNPDPQNGNNIKRVPVKFFPVIVKDIQDAIDSLITESKYPDDRKSFMARVFGDNTIHAQKGTWSSSTRINNGYIVPATNEAGQQTLNPLSNIIDGLWAFPANTNYSGESHVSNPLPRMGVDFKGTQRIRNEPGSIETSASDFPASVIGKRRVEQNVAIVNGQLVQTPGSSVEGIDGIDIPMRPEGRPGPHSRKHETNTSQGFGAENTDPDAGYTFLAHHPLVIQQLRWQPPIIEKFDGPDKIPDAHYTQRVYSNTTPNLPFVFANPAEKTWFMNWGAWLIKGKAKSDSEGLTLIAASDQYDGFIPTTCPFSVFYPPPEVNCACAQGDSSYAVWGAGNLHEVLIWNENLIIQGDNPASHAKRIGPQTRLRVKHTYQVSPGSPNHTHYYAVAIRINSIASLNLQPFIPIYVAPTSNPDSTLTNYLDVKDISPQSHSDGSVSVNIMDAIKKSYPQHAGNGDFVLAMAIFVHQTVKGSKTCPVVDVSGGSIIQPGCPEGLNCSMGTLTSKTNYIMLYEPALEQNDTRLP